MTAVLDASALLAWLQGEPGADVVEAHLEDDAVCAAVNWSEVAQKTTARGASWEIARGLCESYGLRIESTTREDGEAAAALWRSGSGLSLADRCCLALAGRLDATPVTADRSWDADDVVRIR